MGGTVNEVIRILVADDHAIVLEGLNSLINTQADMEIVGHARDGVEVVLKASTLKPDVILLDLVMPGKDGIQVISELRREAPRARVLVLTGFAENYRVFQAIRAGATGYLLKETAPNAILEAIRTVYEGKAVLDPTVAFRVVRNLNDRWNDQWPAGEALTERELEVVKLVAQGLSNQEIAEVLEVSERTIGSHVSHILDKLHLTNRTQLALYALREGLASLDMA